MTDAPPPPPNHAARAAQAGGAGAIAAAVCAAAVAVAPFVHLHEGRRYVAYPDPATHAAPWTICDGHTGPDVHPGDRKTDAQCDALLQADLHKVAVAISPCIHRMAPRDVFRAVDSFAYNVGAAKTCGSTLLRKLNAGDLRGACAELPRWRYAAGVLLPGILRRRIDERALCERGLS